MQNASYWVLNDAAVFIISMMVAGVLIPKIIIIAFRRKLFDDEGERKVHHGYVPRLGGISFFPSYLLSLAIVIAANLRVDSPLMQSILLREGTVFYFLVSAIILLYLVGIADDLVGVRYGVKFVAQIMASVLMISSGMYITDFHGILWLGSIPAWIGCLFTCYVIVYVVNSINLIDGIDGLASGLSIIGLAFYGVVFFKGGEFLYSMIAFAVAGTLLPFFYYNVFGDVKKQKKIFMGDTGALTTGMVIVFCGIGVMCSKPDFLTVDYNPAIVAISPLIVPCFDVCRVYFHRVKRGRNPFLPDKAHIHHKLLALGMSQTWALLSILGVSLMFMGANIFISPYVNPTFILVGDIAVWTLGNMMLTIAIRRREESLGRTLYD